MTDNGRFLMKLRSAGRSLVSDDLKSGQVERVQPEPHHAEQLERLLDLGPFNKAVTTAMERCDKNDPRIDADLAIAVHQALPLTRREGHDKGIWHYLSVIERPDFVRHRWRTDKGVSDERFLGDLVRNAFARLWWGAELTRRENDYAATKILFGNQDLYEAVAGRLFRAYQPAVLAVLSRVGKEKGERAREVCKKFNQVLTTFVVEDMDQPAIEKLVSEIVVESPAGAKRDR